ncbi:hypothetical protein CORMATOL_02775 [Corynebacterium matruchotii ATCC 33806]|uniref:Uncharacterized protein n=1 Tax=Corynebacterium matruchotii ATCC 33806 TaxID=566549 RepID=C0E6Y8_9CORY|nr:hypothetical protein CORMATOL_02775 [Corynebacterium matruchotii ATCC 33806]
MTIQAGDIHDMTVTRTSDMLMCIIENLYQLRSSIPHNSIV